MFWDIRTDFVFTKMNDSTLDYYTNKLSENMRCNVATITIPGGKKKQK